MEVSLIGFFKLKGQFHPLAALCLTATCSWAENGQAWKPS